MGQSGTGTGFETPGQNGATTPAVSGAGRGGVGTGFEPTGGAGIPAAAASGGGGGHGVLGFLGHLASDAKGAIEGLPTGAYDIAKTEAQAVSDDLHGRNTAVNNREWSDLFHGHIGRMFQEPNEGDASAAAAHLADLEKGVANQYATHYGPLFHGHFGQFAHELYAHPLQPILDAATVATFGGAGAAKAGEILNQAGMLSDTSRLATLGKATDLKVPDFGAGEDIIVKQSSRNPVIRLRQEAVNSLLNKLPSETPVFGSTARAVRALSRDPERIAARLQGDAQKATQTFGKLTQPERVAWHLNARGLTPAQYADHLATTGEKVSPATLKALSSKEVARLVANPSENLRAALDAGRTLSDKLTALRVAGGHIDELTALEAPYRHLRLANGATYEAVKEASPALKAATAERDRIAALHEKALQAEEQWASQEPKDFSGGISPEEMHAGLTARIGRLEERAARPPIDATDAYEAKRAAQSAEHLRAIRDEGRAFTPPTPASNPFRDDLVKFGNALEVAQERVDKLAGHTSDTGAVQLVDRPGRDLETLMREIDAQGGEHPVYVPDSAHTPGLRGRFSSRASGFAAQDQGVKQSRGILFSKGLINFNDNSLARDYRSFAAQARAQLLHDELVKHAAIVPKGEPIPHGYEELKLNRGQASAPYTLRAAAPLEHELSQPTLRDRLAELSRQHLDEMNPEEPHRLVVPSQVRKLIEDSASRPHGMLRRLAFDQPTNVWKHLILGLRPAFFGNITIGNSILGALQMAPGRFGIHGWLNQVVPGAERLFGPKLSEETMQHVFPEQAYGTFGHDVGFSPNAGLRAGQKLYQGVMPATIAYENVLRRAMTEGWAKADPEVQALMRHNGGDVNAALREIAQTKPQIINGISRRVDDALGNYRTYNRVERALKAVVPFYGWNRHLTSSVVRLALERPQVLDALYQTGQEGKPLADAILAALPKYLQGSLGVHLPTWLGGEPGMQQLLTMQSLNPFNTIVDEGNMAAAPFHKAGASSDDFPLNPYAEAAIEQLTGTNLLTGHPLKGNAFGNEAQHLTPLQGILHDLIYGRHPSPTATNQNNELGQLLRYLGLPVENVQAP